MLRTSLLAFAALGLAACASPSGEQSAEATPSRDCFQTSQVNGYEIVDDHHVKVRVGASREYILTTNWDTSQLNWTQAIALRSTLDRVCVGNGLGVQIIGGDPQHTYSISGVERVPDEAPTGS